MESGKAGNQFTYRAFDILGNIYQSKEKKDRVYGRGGCLLQKGTTKYKYDACGSLVKKTTEDGIWKYEYGCNSFMKKVVRPDGREVTFQYDALGRRIAKSFDGKTTRFLWDGDVILHEWEQEEREEPQNPVTWLFDEKGFTPLAKITAEEAYSIISDYLGTPFEMYDTSGTKVWENKLDIYGKIVSSEGDASHCYFRFPGQYEDAETGLYYNKFRYYDPDTGQYTQQDPIGLAGNNPTLYGYVWDPNVWVDVLGLNSLKELPFPPSLLGRGGCEKIAKQVQKKIGGQFLQVTSRLENVRFLGPVQYSGGVIEGWHHHVAVIKDNIVFDGMTGSKGMHIDSYKDMYEFKEVLNFEVSDKITVH